MAYGSVNNVDRSRSVRRATRHAFINYIHYSFLFFSSFFLFFFLISFFFLFFNPKNVRVSCIVKLTNLWSCIYIYIYFIYICIYTVIPIFFFFFCFFKVLLFCVFTYTKKDPRNIVSWLTSTHINKIFYFFFYQILFFFLDLVSILYCSFLF